MVGRGFVQVRTDYLDLVRESAAENAIFASATGVAIRASGLDGGGPLLGAAALQLLARV